MTRVWRLIKYVFSRPLMASGIVGMSIHGLLELNEHVFKGTSHLSHLAESIGQMPVYGALYLLTPFLVPYLVTRIGSRILMDVESQCQLRFPQANPDIVMKLGPSGEVLFMNAAAASSLKRLGLEVTEVDTFLPDDTPALVAEIIGTDRTVMREKGVDGRCFEFWFRAFPDEQAVFLSGRDMTRRRELEEEVRQANSFVRGASWNSRNIESLRNNVNKGKPGFI